MSSKQWNPNNLQKLNEEEFIAAFCLATEDRTNLDFKAFTYENQKKNGAPPEAIDYLLAEAERRKIPLQKIAERFAQRAFSGKSFVSNLCSPKSWRKYEIHAAGAIIRLLESDGLTLDKIEYDAKIIGQVTKSERQVDLLLKKESPKRHYVGCEVKNYETGRVSVEKVEAFASKMKDISVDHGVMISPNGFQQSAITTAAHYQITLFSFRELLGKDVPGDLKAQGSLNENELYWVLEHDQQKWIFGGKMTTDRL